MDKCDVNGPNTHEVFKYLRGNSKELISKRDPTKMLQIPWNFCKWIVDKEGKVQMYLNPTIQLHTCHELIEFLIAKSGTKTDEALPSIAVKVD